MSCNCAKKSSEKWLTMLAKRELAEKYNKNVSKTEENGKSKQQLEGSRRQD